MRLGVLRKERPAITGYVFRSPVVPVAFLVWCLDFSLGICETSICEPRRGYFLLDHPLHCIAGAVDVDSEETGACFRVPGIATFCAPDKRPENISVGIWYRKAGDFFRRVPVKTPLGSVHRINPDRSEDAIDEHEPMPSPFIGCFTDNTNQVKAFDWNLDARLFENFALGTLGWGLTGDNIEFATDRREHALIRILCAMDEEYAPVFIADIA
jgi:hypothetical protein